MATDLSIQQAFLDGIEEVYSIMFTQYVTLSLMDITQTSVNSVYNEARGKVYTNDYTLVAKVLTDFKQGDLPTDGVRVDAIISIPTKQLITNNIARETKADLAKLAKGKITYKGIEYLIHYVVPKTLVADEWQVYDFICYIDREGV